MEAMSKYGSDSRDRAIRAQLDSHGSTHVIAFLKSPCRDPEVARRIKRIMCGPGRRPPGPHGTYFRHHRRFGVVIGCVDAVALERLQAEPLVAGVLPESTIEPIMAPPGSPSVSIDAIAWGVESLGVPDLWAKGLDGSGVLIGHLDTGIDHLHPCTAGIAARFALTGFLGGCQEVHFASQDTAYHGTYTSGIAAGRPYAGRSVGVAPGARTCSAVVIEGGVPERRVFDALQWVVKTGIRVLNLSLGFPGYTPLLKPLFTELRAKGILPVVAVGNSGPDSSRWPGNYDEALSVGAAGKGGGLWEDSSSDGAHGDNPPVPDLVAPGDEIPAPVRGENPGPYADTYGTSVAAPHVSGLAALLWQACPDATVDQVEAAILKSCTPLVGVPAERQGRGMPNAPLALKILQAD